MGKIPLTMKEFINSLRAALGDPVDFRLEPAFDDKLAIVFLASLTQRMEIQSSFLGPLQGLEAQMIDLTTAHSWEPILKAVPVAGCTERHNMDEVLADLTTGRTVLYLDGIPTVYSFDTVSVVKRQPIPRKSNGLSGEHGFHLLKTFMTIFLLSVRVLMMSHFGLRVYESGGGPKVRLRYYICRMLLIDQWSGKLNGV